MKKITLAGGCFWGVEGYFDQLKGVLDTTVGYIDGNKKNPTYKEVCSGAATHAEAMEVFYDENVIKLDMVLEHFFRIIDPFSRNRQGHDIGRQYRTGIYYDVEEDKEKVLSFMQNMFGPDLKRVQTEVKQNLDFEAAETYHQDYLKKNPGGYCHVDLNLAKPEEKK
ncbi:MAG: peptide-methionine (S)-S-oxide reductase [Tenericutes bacterium GWC2_34_14]|nr:MAG: peptide-methionine (S)-S-oxide reductase [Tenericutes bacterium GWA2_35_7]OHE29649.1 MAG: peptide-methionine (S)-S-oxide reductase [Tenericutes bacterium GWC2_34_14]OHE34229.1 MAG: peptide-methionine (S)-S-oxide reductase [Tenericutes bacterium GWE2_34_108]OHE35560.1 MAG: peptide-methionine (S)-S-oxide reductase [Tenericutes bacterium GWF1_35_14]OHE38521.1 MAG: peptide-methionine (S)-S-oxide reductase [Tenericutes bacterium GWF2_35_184]OHE43699.1 MAG: peptide-methionine (S)-S-oxide red